jgi:tetraacyldisaccharide 4'-kinase
LLSRYLEDLWYGASPLAWLLLPLSGAFCLAVGVRRLAYRRGWLRRVRLAVPVVVVGNLVVGGTGKTPLVAWLARYLAEEGWQPGVVSRGYGGRSHHWPREVHSDSDPAEVGDEPVLLARRCGCPVAVGPDRVASAQHLVQARECNLILSDDGLQHYALERQVEVAVIDGERRLGNGHCLPAGPLREPASRLLGPRLIRVCNGGTPAAGELIMRMQPGPLWSLISPQTTRPLSAFRGQEVHAVAAIAHPKRFFTVLSDAGLHVRAHAFPDHHRFRQTDIEFPDRLPVLMTEKDAVKCSRFPAPGYWVLPVEAVPEGSLREVLAARLRAWREEAGTSRRELVKQP